MRPSIPDLTPKAHAQDKFGCMAGKLQIDQQFFASGVKLFRKQTEDAALGQVGTVANDKGILVGLSLTGGHQRRLLQGSQSSSYVFEKDSVYVRNFADDYRADLKGAFDFLLLEIPACLLNRLAEEIGSPPVTGLRMATAVMDPVLSHLLRALQPALDHPGHASILFVDQVALAMGTHLMQKYGSVVPASSQQARSMSVAHERRAKEILSSRLSGDVSIAEIANACGLSRSHFTRVFRETIGHTPHRWLTLQRIEHARTLLKKPHANLAEIALTCGFADQSHFTRVFAQFIGTSPGKWQQAMRKQ